MKQLIACCGLDCETCEARIATVTDDNLLREKVAKEWGELNQMEMKPEWINCMGVSHRRVQDLLLQRTVQDSPMCYAERLRHLRQLLRTAHLQHAGRAGQERSPCI